MRMRTINRCGWEMFSSRGNVSLNRKLVIIDTNKWHFFSIPFQWYQSGILEGIMMYNHFDSCQRKITIIETTVRVIENSPGLKQGWKNDFCLMLTCIGTEEIQKPISQFCPPHPHVQPGLFIISMNHFRPYLQDSLLKSYSSTQNHFTMG